MSQTSQCSICLKDVTILPQKLNCEHVFCYLCLKFSIMSNGSTCPLCRREYDSNILNDATLDNVEQLKSNDMDIKWYYEGRSDGYWQYDIVSTQHLEEAYQEWKHNDDNHIELDYYPDYGTTEAELEETGFIPIAIGDINKFYVNFDGMYQYNHRNGASRKIIRQEKDDNNDIVVKGIAGVKINRIKYSDLAKTK